MEGHESAGSGIRRANADERFLMRNTFQIALAKRAFPGSDGGSAMMEWATGPLSGRFERYEKAHPELDFADTDAGTLDAVIEDLRVMTDETIH